jgi:hypothetical protein
MARAISRCPNCREPVSPFAAGCAICGADLEAARKELAARKPIVKAPNVRLPRVGGGQIEWIQVVLAVALAVAFSLVGLLLSLYWANQRHQQGNRPMTGLMLASAAIAIAAIVEPFWFLNNLGI